MSALSCAKCADMAFVYLFRNEFVYFFDLWSYIMYISYCTGGHN